MNILITGTTGFVGRRLCRVLAERGHNITCFVRKNSDITHLKDFSVIKGSLSDKKLLKSIENIDMVFHLAALRGERHLPFKEYEKINVLAAENLLETFKNSRFIYCSTVGVMGYGTGLCETSPLRPAGNSRVETFFSLVLRQTFPVESLAREEPIQHPATFGFRRCPLSLDVLAAFWSPSPRSEGEVPNVSVQESWG